MSIWCTKLHKWHSEFSKRQEKMLQIRPFCLTITNWLSNCNLNNFQIEQISWRNLIIVAITHLKINPFHLLQCWQYIFISIIYCKVICFPLLTYLLHYRLITEECISIYAKFMNYLIHCFKTPIVFNYLFYFHASIIHIIMHNWIVHREQR